MFSPFDVPAGTEGYVQSCTRGPVVWTFLSLMGFQPTISDFQHSVLTTTLQTSLGGSNFCLL